MSCLPKLPLCHLNASVVQSSTILPGNTSTSSVDQDTQICVLYSCKSPLTATLSCPLAKAFPGKAGTHECLSLHLHCMQHLEPALSFQSLISKAETPSKSLKEEEGLWEQAGVGIWCEGPWKNGQALQLSAGNAGNCKGNCGLLKYWSFWQLCKLTRF